LALSLRSAAWSVLVQADVEEKLGRLLGLAVAELPVGSVPASEQIRATPGRPERPLRVAPARVKHRSMVTPEGRAALVHALAHIEFNAINLALDAAVRFDGMPDAFYRDWIRVAREEAYHFILLRDHLARLGYAYGDFPAHDGLWDMAEKTKGDVLARIALVPRTLEARGLDASPLIRAKLAQAGDLKAALIIDTILHDEIGHVAIGNLWYRWLCAERELDPIGTYWELAQRFDAPVPRGPFNVAARLAAGFDTEELQLLEANASARAMRG